jgi:hypothetical protein
MAFLIFSGYGPFRNHVMACDLVSVSVEASPIKAIAPADHGHPGLTGGDSELKRTVCIV